MTTFNNNYLSQKHFIAILLFFCVIFNIIIARHYHHTSLGLDESTYNGIALALLNGTTEAHVFSFNIDIGQEVTPFYSLIVAFAYWIYPSIESVIVIQVLLNCFTIILLFLTLKIITRNQLLSFLMAFVSIFYFPLWAYNHFVMMEVPTVFLLSSIIYLLSLYFYKNKDRYLYLSIVLFSSLVLMNNRFIILLGALMAYLLLLIIQKKQVMFKNLLYSILISILIISPWFIRQYFTYQQLVLFTPLWHNVVADKTGLFDRVPNKSIEEHYPSNGPLSYEELIKQQERSGLSITFLPSKEKYQELIRRNAPGNIYLQRLKRYFTLYTRDYQFMYPGEYRLLIPASLPFMVIQLTILLPLLILSLLASILAIIKRDTFMILLFGLLTAHLALHVVIHYIDRYRLTIIPLLIILAGYSTNEIIKAVKLKRTVNYQQII